MLDSSRHNRMNDTPSPATPAPAENFLHKIFWALLVFITLYVCYFSHLGAFGFVGPDEPRYAWIARDMAESGDWVTPRLYGKPWFEKPVLYYWSAALSFKLFGVSEATARLPSAVFALLATLSLAWLALRMADPEKESSEAIDTQLGVPANGKSEFARWVLLLVPTSVAMVGFSHAAAPDMPFSAALTMAMVCAATIRGLAQCPLPRYALFSLFGFFLGAAVLAKGPAALILAGGSMILWAAFTKRWRDALPLFHPLGIAAFLMTCLPWYVICARRNPDFFRVFIIEHNFKRYLTPEFQHLQPFWYYVPIAIVALLPWVFWLLWFAFRRARTAAMAVSRDAFLFFAAWSIFPILFFSASKSKLPGYILPAIFPLAFLISLAVKDATRSTHHFRGYAAAFPGALFLAAACWPLFSRVQPRGSLVIAAMVVALVGGLSVMACAMLRRTHTALALSVIVVLFLLTFTYGSAARLDPKLSARFSAAQISPQQAPVTYSYKLQRACQYQLNFYLHREITEWSPEIAGESVVVTNQKNLPELKTRAEIVSMISEISPQAEVVIVSPKTLGLHVAGSRQPQ
jgi:4-amino-4-deoxy-L-arabinose transferase-like glycosyltransferase